MTSTVSNTSASPSNSSSASINKTDERIWFLDVLRGLAAITVMYAHLGIAFWISNAEVSRLAFTKPLGQNFHLFFDQPLIWLQALNINLSQLAVAVFFLISGFVMPMTLSSKSRLGFLAARVFRLYPTYLLTLPLTCAVIYAYCVYQQHPFPYTSQVIFANCSLFRDLLWLPSIDGANWTLEIEIKFYLCCALLGAALITRARAILATAVVLSALSFWSTVEFHHLLTSNIKLYELKYVMLMDCPRLIFMLIGSVICNYWRKLWGYKKALAVAGILLAAFLITAHWALLSSPAEKPTISTYLFALVIFVCSYFGRSRFPRWKQLAFLSNISYPLYLIHGVNGYILLTVFYPYLPVPWLDNVVVFSILIGAAWLIHRFIEIPSHKFGQRLGTKLSQ